MNNQETRINEECNNFTNAIIPFGSLDVRRAMQIVLEVGKNGEWFAEELEQYTQETGTKIQDVDIVALVYRIISAIARNEIAELTGFDFSNNGAEIYTIGNYLATSYCWEERAVELISEKIKDLDPENLEPATKWFLDEIEAI